MENGNNSRLSQLLMSYGADRSRWPADERLISTPGDGAAEEEALAVDRLLALASRPDVPPGAMVRLLQQIESRRSADVVGLGPPARRRRPFIRYVAALPLAASLVLGIYLGAQGSLDFMLPSTITGGMAVNDEVPDDLGGVGEADAYAKENLS